jgi:hypothetical protein
VVIEIIDIKHIAFKKSEDHPPIGSNRNCPKAPPGTFERVKPETRKIQIPSRSGCVQARKDVAQLGQVLREDAARVVVLIKASQPSVAEGLDRNPS